MSKRSGPQTRVQSEPTKIEDARSNGVRPLPGESRRQDPTESVWNDLQSDTGGPPTTEGAPVVDEGKVEGDKEQQIRALLNKQLVKDEPAEGETAEEPETKTDEPVKTEVTEPAKPTRRDMLGNLDAEKQKRKLERELKEERAARQTAEAALKGDLLAVARAKGLTKDQALNAILEAPDSTPAAAIAAADPINERLSRLEQRERDLNQRQALEVVETLTKDLDIPLVRASARIAVQDDKGVTRYLSGRELVLETAQQLWLDDGEPRDAQGRPTGQTEYIRRAAAAAEEQLYEDDRPRFEAVIAKKAKAPAAAPVKKEAAPAVGRRTGGAGPKVSAGDGLPEDVDERRMAIKARMGWK